MGGGTRLPTVFLYTEACVLAQLNCHPCRYKSTWLCPSQNSQQFFACLFSTKETSPQYWGLIKSYEKITACVTPMAGT